VMRSHGFAHLGRRFHVLAVLERGNRVLLDPLRLLVLQVVTQCAICDHVQKVVDPTIHLELALDFAHDDRQQTMCEECFY
jgi:hypothetical protein